MRNSNAPRPRRAIATRVAASVVVIAAQITTACSTDNPSGGASGGSGSGGRAGSNTAGSAGSSGGGPRSAGEAGAAREAGVAGADQTIGDRRMPFSPADDAQFSAFFAEHHRIAIAMADMEVSKGAAADVKALAAGMSHSQSNELKVLESALAALTEDTAQTPADAHMEADMAQMMSLSGPDLDRMFLQEMIPHHAAGLAPAHRALRILKRPELIALAKSIFSNQAEEIGQMRGMLTSMGAIDAGEDLAISTAGRADFGLVGDLRVPLTPDGDVTFIDFFVPHHRAAIAMAEEEIARGSDTAIVDMATMARDTQTDEVSIMTAARTALTGSAEPTPPPDDPHMTSDMAAMKDVSGAALDQMFLTEMIPHHGAALPPSHRANPHVKRADLRSLADKMYTEQGKEIGVMAALLK